MVHLTEKRKNVFGHKLAKLVKRALKMTGKVNLNPFHCYQFDDCDSNRCPEPAEGSQVKHEST